MAPTTDLLSLNMIIDGKGAPAADGATFETVSPATNLPIAIVPKRHQWTSNVPSWPPVRHSMMAPGPASPLERSRALNQVADILRERVEEIARLER